MYDISKLERAKLERGLTTLELAKKARKPESTVRGLFANRSAHPKTIKAVARALGFTLADIIEESAEKKSA